MSLQFTQREVESELRDLLVHGDIRRLSLITGLGETYISQQLNPDDERVSYPYRFLQILCALDEIDPGRGGLFFDAIARFRDLSRIRLSAELCAVSETSKLLGEHSEFIDSRLRGKPLPEQLKELDDLVRQIKVVKSAIVTEHLKTKEKTNANE